MIAWAPPSPLGFAAVGEVAMKDDEVDIAPESADRSAGYRPPTVTYLGSLAELTQKHVGAADGSTFLGIDLGSV